MNPDVGVPLSATARLRLFPLVMKAGSDGFLVIRRDTGRILQTSQAGVDSIRLMRKGLTLEAVAQTLGRKYGFDPATVDLMPLVQSLLAADFIRQIDGRVVSTSTVCVSRLVRGTFAARVAAPLTTALIRHAPLGVSLALLLRTGRPQESEVACQIASVMTSLPGLSRSAADLDVVARRNAAALRQYHLERLLLGVLPPDKLDRWLRDRVTITGRVHLDDAAASGRGVVLFAFHMSAYSLVPFILAANGCPHVVLVAGLEPARAEIRRRIEQLREAGCTYPLSLVSAGPGTRDLLRRLREGGTVLVFCDATPDGSDRCVTVPFLGNGLRLATGIARVSARAGARVLPVVLTSKPRGRYSLVIEPPLPTATTPEDLMRSIGAVLEREVRRRPDEWLKWKDLGAMIGPPGSGS